MLDFVIIKFIVSLVQIKKFDRLLKTEFEKEE